MECDVCGDPFIGIIGLSKRCSKTCRKKKGSRIHWPHFKQQAQWCAICGSEDGLVGDHNHVTGENRGVLCSRCNSGIGMLGDSPERLLDAYAYLLNYATTTEGVPS